MVAVDGIPRSVILINWALSLLAIGGLRVVARWLLTKSSPILRDQTDNKKECRKVLVYGAGDAGIQLVSALEHSKEYCPVGLIDDDRALQGSQIKGLSVGSIVDIKNTIHRHKVDEVLIAMPSASRTRKLAIINELEPYPVMVRTLPGVSEFIYKGVRVNLPQ